MIKIGFVAEMLNGRVRRACHTTRYSSVPVIRQETVAEHTYFTCMYAYMIATHMVREGFQVEYGTLLSRALVHDTEETETGDLLRKVKHHSPEILEALQAIGATAVERIDRSLGLDGIMLDDWLNAKDESIEGRILRVADLLSVVSYLVEEYQLGNRLQLEVHHEVLEYIQQTKQKVNNSFLLELLGDAESYFRHSIRYVHVETLS